MLTTFDGEYVPWPLVSFQPSGYAVHFDDTADGKLPSGTAVGKSSTNT
jgi:hypothetical protein